MGLFSFYGPRPALNYAADYLSWLRSLNFLFAVSNLNSLNLEFLNWFNFIFGTEINETIKSFSIDIDMRNVYYLQAF